MKKIKKYKIQTYINRTGKLMPISFDKKLSFNAKRIFFLYGKKNKIRGNHAHKKCSQLFFSISGKVILNVTTPFFKKKMVLDKLSKSAVLIPPMHWCSVKFIEKNSILMVVCDKYYNVNDYLRTFKVYKKYLKKK